MSQTSTSWYNRSRYHTITRLQKRNALKPQGADAVERCSCCISPDDIRRHELVIYYHQVHVSMKNRKNKNMFNLYSWKKDLKASAHPCPPPPPPGQVGLLLRPPPTNHPAEPWAQSGNRQHRLISLWESPKPTMRGYLPTRFEVTAWGWVASY